MHFLLYLFFPILFFVNHTHAFKSNIPPDNSSLKSEHWEEEKEIQSKRLVRVYEIEKNNERFLESLYIFYTQSHTPYRIVHYCHNGDREQIDLLPQNQTSQHFQPYNNSNSFQSIQISLLPNHLTIRDVRIQLILNNISSSNPSHSPLLRMDHISHFENDVTLSGIFENNLHSFTITLPHSRIEGTLSRQSLIFTTTKLNDNSITQYEFSLEQLIQGMLSPQPTLSYLRSTFGDVGYYLYFILHISPQHPLDSLNELGLPSSFLHFFSLQNFDPFFWIFENKKKKEEPNDSPKTKKSPSPLRQLFRLADYPKKLVKQISAPQLQRINVELQRDSDHSPKDDSKLRTTSPDKNHRSSLHIKKVNSNNIEQNSLSSQKSSTDTPPTSQNQSSSPKLKNFKFYPNPEEDKELSPPPSKRERSDNSPLRHSSSHLSPKKQNKPTAETNPKKLNRKNSLNSSDFTPGFLTRRQNRTPEEAPKPIERPASIPPLKLEEVFKKVNFAERLSP